MAACGCNGGRNPGHTVANCRYKPPTVGDPKPWDRKWPPPGGGGQEEEPVPAGKDWRRQGQRPHRRG